MPGSRALALARVEGEEPSWVWVKPGDTYGE